eukprot:447437-Alexandrium_andersonii.AAC.1
MRRVEMRNAFAKALSTNCATEEYIMSKNHDDLPATTAMQKTANYIKMAVKNTYATEMYIAMQATATEM